MAQRYCEHCKKNTEYREIVRQKPSKFGTSRKEKVKAFFSGFFSGWGSGGLAWIELTDRYVVCQECGEQVKENFGEKFQ